MVPDDDVVPEAPEGKLLTSIHVRRERNAKIVKEKKKQVLDATGALACEGCTFDFGAVYGDHGSGFIECHHVQPLHTDKKGQRTKLSDLAVACSNCHR